jgi:hypothetical protein
MRLIELDPHFLVRRPSTEDGYQHVLERTDNVAVADGIRFLCPRCYEKNGGAAGTHQIRVPFAGRGLGQMGWHVAGTSFSDLTLTPSIALPGERCGFHGFITNGEVIFA